MQGIYNLTTSTLGFGLLVPFLRASGSGPQSPLSKRPFRSANSASVSKPRVRSSAKSFSSFAQSAVHRGFFRGGSKGVLPVAAAGSGGSGGGTGAATSGLGEEGLRVERGGCQRGCGTEAVVGKCARMRARA